MSLRLNLFSSCNLNYVSETGDGYIVIDSPQQPIDAERWWERLEESAHLIPHRRTEITSPATPISRR